MNREAIIKSITVKFEANSSSHTDESTPAIIVTKPGKAMTIEEKKKEWRKSLILQYHPMICRVCGCEFSVNHRIYKDKLVHCPNQSCSVHINIGNRCTIL